MTSLVICCDGTWDNADQEKDKSTGELCVSNVLKIACRAAKRGCTFAVDRNCLTLAESV